MDSAYRNAHYVLSELSHGYGPHVHILAHPLAMTWLSRLCATSTHQPEISRLVSRLYEDMVIAVINHAFPRRRVQTATRMVASTERAVLDVEQVDPNTRVVCVDVARAGMLPSQVCFDTCNTVFDPAGVRQDHLIVARTTDDAHQVTGAAILGGKVGGPIDDAYVLIPDPMGATGTSIATVIDYLKANHGKAPARILSLNLIVTPEFIRNMQAAHPEVEIYAWRVDRGMSDPAVLAKNLGAEPSGERGLNDVDYIVPGGGGFGEILNNAFV